MKPTLKCLFVVMLMFFYNIHFVPSSLAAESTLTIDGRIVASGCNVDKVPEIKIGSFSAKDFPTVGSTSAFKAMNISLSDCYSKLKNVQVKFSGTTDTTDPTLLAVTDTGSGGTLATGIGVELLDNSMKILPFNSTDPLVYELDGESNTLSFLMRYKSTKTLVTPGEASAVMFFDLIYQ